MNRRVQVRMKSSSCRKRENPCLRTDFAQNIMYRGKDGAGRVSGNPGHVGLSYLRDTTTTPSARRDEGTA